MRRQANYPLPRYNDPMDRRMVKIIRPARSAEKRAVNIIGIPFDGAVLGRKGAAGGPAGIRGAMAGFSNYNVELGVGLEDSKVLDLGDLVLQDEGVFKAHSQIYAEVARDLERSSLLVVLGGDNSISLPSLRACSRKFGKIGLIAIDSHFDLRGKIGGKPTSGSSYGLAVESADGLDPKRVVEIGIHGFLNSKAYFEKAKGLGLTLITAEEVGLRGPEVVAKEAYRIASKGASVVYLSIDLDAVDLAYVSGVSAPSAGGLAAGPLFKLACLLARKTGVVCSDIVELAPALDPTGRSERVASTILAYLIAGFALRSK